MTILRHPERRLVHVDLHGDDNFGCDHHFAGIIDWGDALCSDPHCDLPSLFFCAFGVPVGSQSAVWMPSNATTPISVGAFVNAPAAGILRSDSFSCVAVRL